MTADTFDRACSRVEAAVTGTIRQEIVSDVSRSADFRQAMLRLRDDMRANVLKAGGDRFVFEELVGEYDAQTRQDGFHVLHDWDGKAEKVNDDTIAVDVLNYLIEKRAAGPVDRTVLAISLDYYFVYLLALLALRAWDEGDADDNLDRLNRLLADLQGRGGSGQQFVDNVETLVLIATSHYEPSDAAYDTLLAKVRTLNQFHRTRLALVHAASLGSHLRFGFEATYGRDIVLMRDDNTVDYPWVCFSLATLMHEYARMHDEAIHGIERDTIVEAMLNGLSFDARAFVGTAPSSLSPHERERSGFREGFHRYRQDLLKEFERHRPSALAYSPISFFFNFAYNILKGTVVDALLRGEAWNLTLNDLLTGVSRGEPKEASKETLVTTLMGYARANPDTIRGRLMPVIVYDPRAGREAFAVMMRKIREQV